MTWVRTHVPSWTWVVGAGLVSLAVAFRSVKTVANAVVAAPLANVPAYIERRGERLVVCNALADELWTADSDIPWQDLTSAVIRELGRVVELDDKGLPEVVLLPAERRPGPLNELEVRDADGSRRWAMTLRDALPQLEGVEFYGGLYLIPLDEPGDAALDARFLLVVWSHDETVTGVSAFGAHGGPPLATYRHPGKLSASARWSIDATQPSMVALGGSNHLLQEATTVVLDPQGLGAGQPRPDEHGASWAKTTRDSRFMYIHLAPPVPLTWAGSDRFCVGSLASRGDWLRLSLRVEGATLYAYLSASGKRRVFADDLYAPMYEARLRDKLFAEPLRAHLTTVAATLECETPLRR